MQTQISKCIFRKKIILILVKILVFVKKKKFFSETMAVDVSVVTDIHVCAWGRVGNQQCLTRKWLI